MKKTIISILSLTLSLCMLVYTVYAWFTFKKTLNNLIITTGNVDCVAVLYKGIDFNKDGILDVNSADEDEYVLLDTSIVTLVEGLCPGEYVTFKLNVENTGDYDGLLSVEFSSFDGVLKDVLYVDDGTGLSNSAQLLNEGNRIITQDNLITEGNNSDFIFKIKFAELEELQNVSSTFESYQNLDAYQSYEGNVKTFTMTVTVTMTQYM